MGTAMLRAQLLPATVRTETQNLLREHLDLRILGGTISLDQAEERSAVLRESGQVLDQDANPVTTGLFIQALNELIDAYGTRDAALNRHVPEAVLFLLFGTFILTACLVGFASGVAGHRASFPTYILVALIVLLRQTESSPPRMFAFCCPAPKATRRAACGRIGVVCAPSVLRLIAM
jgi:hypothetical protein